MPLANEKFRKRGDKIIDSIQVEVEEGRTLIKI